MVKRRPEGDDEQRHRSREAGDAPTRRSDPADGDRYSSDKTGMTTVVSTSACHAYGERVCASSTSRRLEAARAEAANVAVSAGVAQW